ncbi:hypothetical protein [Arenibaculum pallidiluteum]|uniref:hypothetical protein n=1 Tax=Arenibaculum pallidiluteum TaxID=2812559 RepID=UPI001A969724|nr:hypothetical protein [Arenibaculum pallidiluteum]
MRSIRLLPLAAAIIAPVTLAACGSDSKVTERTTTTTTSRSDVLPSDRSVTVERTTKVEED